MNGFNYNANENINLLPGGFVDLLPDQADKEAFAINVLMEVFKGYGYARIKPPLVEFEKSLFAPGPGAALPHETFRVLDPLSHRMMGIRSDLTGQIARIAASRMAETPRPLRLCYANDVLRTTGSQIRTERQFCQAGCEIVGKNDEQTIIELCVLSLMGLHKLGLNNLSLDLTLPDLIPHVLERYTLTDVEIENIHKALDHKDVGSIQALENKELSAILISLVRSAGEADTVIEALDGMNWSREAEESIQTLKNVVGALKQALKDLRMKDVVLTVDPAERRGHAYHHGLAFTVFGTGIRSALGRGGGYNIVHASKDRAESATGFTLYMDVVCKAMSVPMVDRETIFLSTNENWQTAQDLFNDGWIVIRGSDKEIPDIAVCTHIFEDGQIKKRKG